MQFTDGNTFVRRGRLVAPRKPIKPEPAFVATDYGGGYVLYSRRGSMAASTVEEARYQFWQWQQAFDRGEPVRAQ